MYDTDQLVQILHHKILATCHLFYLLLYSISSINVQFLILLLNGT